jgi:hypothetical protein
METAGGATWDLAYKGKDGWFGKREEDNFLQLKSNGTGLPLYLFFIIFLFFYFLGGFLFRTVFYFPPTFWSLIFRQNSLFSFK